MNVILAWSMQREQLLSIYWAWLIAASMEIQEHLKNFKPHSREEIFEQETLPSKMTITFARPVLILDGGKGDDEIAESL